MPSEFTEYPQDPETQTASGRGIRPPNKFVATDVLDGPEVSPPAGLMHKRRHISVWLAIALLLGALIALILIGLASD